MGLLDALKTILNKGANSMEQTKTANSELLERLLSMNDVEERPKEEIIEEHGQQEDSLFRRLMGEEKYQETKKKLNSFLTAYREFHETFKDILENTDVEDWCELAGITEEQMEDMTQYEILMLIREKHGFFGEEVEDAIEVMEEIVEIAKTKRVDDYFMPIDKVSRFLFEGRAEHGDKHIPISTSKKSKNHHALVSMEFMNLPNVTSSTNFNYYEWQVHNALVSLSLQNEWVTDYMIYEVLSRSYYNKSDANPSESALEEIQQIVNKIINCRIVIDGSKDGTQKDDDVRYLEGYLISADKQVRILNGKRREGYRIARNSLAYHYAKSKGQVVTVPLQLLHTKVRFSKDTSVLKEYLVLRIEGMKNKKNKIKQNDILYDTMFSYISFDDVKGKAIFNKKKRLKGQVEKMLQELVDIEYIKGFEMQKDRIKIAV